MQSMQYYAEVWSTLACTSGVTEASWGKKALPVLIDLRLSVGVFGFSCIKITWLFYCSGTQYTAILSYMKLRPVHQFFKRNARWSTMSKPDLGGFYCLFASSVKNWTVLVKNTYLMHILWLFWCMFNLTPFLHFFPKMICAYSFDGKCGPVWKPLHFPPFSSLVSAYYDTIR